MEAASPATESGAPTTFAKRLIRAAADRPWLWLLPALALLVLMVKWWWLPGKDASAYLSIAKHMANGELMRFGEAHLRYAPGYPAQIAPAFWLSDRPFLAISVIHLLMAVGFTAALFAWFRRVTPQAAGPLTALVLVNISFLHLYEETLSELAYMAWLMGAAVAGAKSLEAKQTRQVVLWTALSAVAIVISAYTRQVGAFLVGGFGLASLILAIRKDISWTRAILTTGGMTLAVFFIVLALVLWDKGRADSSKSYGDYLVSEEMTFFQQFLEALRYRVGATGRLLIPGMHKAYGGWSNPATLLSIAFTALSCWGWARLVRAKADPLLLMAPFYVLFFIFWPYSASTRYWVPMLPIILATLFVLLECWPEKRMLGIFVLIIAHAAVSLGDWGRKLEERLAWHRYWAQFDALETSPAFEPSHLHGYRLPDEVYLMLMLDLNTSFDNVRDPAEIDAGTQWLIVPNKIDAPPHFDEAQRTQDIKLLRRQGAPS